MDDKSKWVINGSTALYSLDKTHMLFVTKEKNGIKIKVRDFPESSEKSILLFSYFISDAQLGHVYGKEK